MAEIIVISRTVSNIILPNDGNPMTILNGGVANSTTVNRSDTLNVSSGGMANSTTVNGMAAYIFPMVAWRMTSRWVMAK